MDYSTYQLNDFLHNDSFVRWVLHPDEPSQWAQVPATWPDKATQIAEAKGLILAVYESERAQIPVIRASTVWQAIAEQLHDAPLMVNLQAPVLPFWQRPALRWAGLMLLTAGLAGWFWTQAQQPLHINYSELVASTQQRYPHYQEVCATQTRQAVRLADGTVVYLSKGSRLSYPLHFAGDRREVILTGEAFFEVAEKSNHPFYVYANEVVTKVLGTAFRITAPDNARQVLVEVRSGKVTVFTQHRIDQADPETKGLILLPNQQAVFDRSREELNRRLVPDPLPIDSHGMTVSRRFDDTPVSTVLTELVRIYGVEIRYNEGSLANCVITTTLHGQSLYDQLDIICQTIGASYKEIDAQIVIESAGCN